MKYLKPLASGEVIGAFALSEPEAGSDATSQKTTAEEGASVSNMELRHLAFSATPPFPPHVRARRNNRRLRHSSIRRSPP